MNARLFLMIFAMLWVPVVLPSPGPDTHPNVILFLVDDMGWSDLGVTGSDIYETPNIDEFASKGVRFTSAYAAGHVCSPTRASLMTGKYPARLQLTDWLPGRASRDTDAVITAPKAAALALSERTIAEAFKAHGYRTGIFGKWHLGDGEYGPTNQGFDVHVPQWNGCCPRGGYHPPYSMPGLSIEGREDEYLTDRLTDFAVEFIREESGKPYFLYLSHFSVHDPIQGREDLVAKYKEKLSGKAAQSEPAFILEGNPDDPEPLTTGQLDALLQTHDGHFGLPNRTVKIKQSQDNVEFAAMVESVDESLGRILGAVKANGGADDTIIVFYSDNGGMSAANGGGWGKMKAKAKAKNFSLDAAYATSNLPLRAGKGWLYEGGIRVPLIVHWPKAGAEGVISDSPVTSTDFYPTLLEMAGLPTAPEQHVDGVSFTDALRNKPLEPRSLFWHFPHYSNHGQQSPAGAIRSGAYKLLEYFENGTTQLFNLNDDPGEQVDLVDLDPERAAGLLAELHAWRASVGAAMPIRRKME